MLRIISIGLLLATTALFEVKSDYPVWMKRETTSQCLADWHFGGGADNLTHYKICALEGSMSSCCGDIQGILAKLNSMYAVVNTTYDLGVQLSNEHAAWGVNITNKLMDICGKPNDIQSPLESSIEEEDFYTLAFRGKAETDGDIFEAWTGADNWRVTTNSSSPCAVWPPTFESRAECRYHYRNPTVFNGNAWAASVVKVKYVLYHMGVEVQSYVFNAIDSDIISWFASYRLQDSKCCTCSNFDDDHPADFSLEGTTDPPSVSARRFQIVTNSHSCSNYKGLTMIVNTPIKNPSERCEFDAISGFYPKFLYSYGNCGINFNIDTQYDAADTMGVLVMKAPQRNLRKTIN